MMDDVTGSSAPAAGAPAPADATPAPNASGHQAGTGQQEDARKSQPGDLGAPSTSTTDPLTQAPSYSQIDVQPCDLNGGPNFYVVSAINTSGRRTSARRRFNDVVAMHEALKVTFRGCVIPFRPGKTFANSTMLRNHKDSFLKDRAYAIRCYLAKVVCHPEIRTAEAVTQFMESEEALSDSTVWSKAQPRRVSVMTGFIKSVKKLAGAEPRIPTPSQVESGGGRSEHDLVRQMAEIYISRKALHDTQDPVEKELFEIGDTIPDMLKANQALATGAAAMIDSARALIDSHADNGAGLQTLWKFEKEWLGRPELHLSQATLETCAACVDTFGRCMSNTAALTKQMAVLEPISDHAFSLPRVEKALAARMDALVVLEALKRQEGIISASYTVLLGKERSGAMSNADVSRMNRVRGETDQVAQAKEAGERTLALLTKRNQRDIAWYKHGRAAQMCDMVAQLAASQAAFQESQAQLWLGMAARVGAQTSGFGDHLERLVLNDLGLKPSKSAVMVEPVLEDDDETGVPVGQGPLPAEIAGAAGGV